MAQEATIRQSFAVCRAILKQSHSSFAPAFRLLPRDKRQAMDALYAFMRITDDLSDEPGSQESKRLVLQSWRQQLDAALHGEDSHPIHPAIRTIVERYCIPSEYFHAVLNGVEKDLYVIRFQTEAELHTYCYEVASAVGICCIYIWGFRSQQAIAYADAAGQALQRTNILRDLGEDLQRGRVYLPEEVWRPYSLVPEEWPKHRRSPSFQEMMYQQIQAIKRYYDDANRLFAELETDGKPIYQVMLGTYRELLHRIERQHGDVFTTRVRVPKWKKIQLLLQAIVRRGIGSF